MILSLKLSVFPGFTLFQTEVHLTTTEDAEDFLSRINALSFSPRTYALTIGVSPDTVKTWTGLRPYSSAPEWARRQLALFENNRIALEDMKREHPVPIRPRGKPFEIGNKFGKRFS